METKSKTCWLCGGTINNNIVEKLGLSIAEIGLSSRAFNCLSRSGIEYVEQLVKLGISDLKRIRNMGTLTLNEIKEKIKNFGFDCW